MISSDFSLAAEKVTIWVFLGTYMLCLGLMVPEVLFGASEANMALCALANICLLVVSVCWMTVIALLVLARKYLEKRPADIFYA